MKNAPTVQATKLIALFATSVSTVRSTFATAVTAVQGAPLFAPSATKNARPVPMISFAAIVTSAGTVSEVRATTVRSADYAKTA